MGSRNRFESFGVGLALLALLGGSAVGVGALQPASAADVVLIGNDFEADSIAPWGPRGPVSLTIAEEGHESEHSMLVSGRTGNWNGPATPVDALFEPTVEYTVSAWVKLAEGTTGTSAMHFTVQETSDVETYTWVGGAVDVTADAWVQLSGNYTMPAGLSAATLYIEAAAIGESHPGFLVDDVQVTGPEAPVEHGLNNDFEADLGAWAARGDGNATAAVTTDEAYAGTQSALVSGRTNNWNGLGADVTTRLVAGSTYTFSAFVKLAAGAESPADVRLSLERVFEGATTYLTLATVTGVTPDSWVEVSASYTMPELSSGLLYFETVTGTSSFLVDNILVELDTAPPVQTDIPSLKDELPWPIGVAIDERETTGSGAELVTKHFDQITPENYMKPESIQPTEGNFTFAAADQLVDFAIANDMNVYGHTLVWHSQTPEWFFQDAEGNPLTASDEHQAILEERMRVHIQTIADHYRTEYGEYGTEGNPIIAFDVVNEAIAENEEDGLRRSEWYRILGEDYIDLAFEIASDAFNGGVVGGPVKLFLNDYNTELPGKRTAMSDVAARLLDRDVPIDGLGHQFHVALTQSVAQMKASIDAFAEHGLLQAVTELDVQIDGTVTEEKLIEQGYYYADVFDMLREYEDLFAVTVWGPYDSRSWRTGAPLVFDDNLQAKHAYWGIVDRGELPGLVRQANAFEADVALDPSALEWQLLPLLPIGGDGGFQVRWSSDHVTVFAHVDDATDDGAADTVEIFARDGVTAVPRTGASGSAVENTATGYTVVVEIPLSGLAVGGTLPFDLRVTDGSTGEQVSWNDLANDQESGDNLGVVTLVDPVGYVAVPLADTTPVVDGVIDPVWVGAPAVSTDVQVEGTPGATATVRTLWSDDAVHVLFEVTDAQLNEANSNAWEQDSVEVFLDPVNAKAGEYSPEDGQYRISFSNAQSISGDLAVIGDRLESATSVIDGGYLVEATIALEVDVEPGAFVGLDFQVNDATDGVRNSVRTWTDPTGRSYQDTSRWGVGHLVGSDVDDDPKVVLGSDEVIAGGSVAVTLTGFEPGTEVDIHLANPPAAAAASIGRSVAAALAAPILLATVTIGDDGTASSIVTIPASTPPDEYAITAGTGGDVLASAGLLVLAAAPGPGGVLGSTGADVAGLVVGALLLLGAGVSLAFYRRGQRTAAS